MRCYLLTAYGCRAASTGGGGWRRRRTASRNSRFMFSFSTNVTRPRWGRMRLVIAMVSAALLLLAACAGRLPSIDETNAVVSRLRAHDVWAWALGIGLIWADLVLPIPQTAIIAALGIVYGA